MNLIFSFILLINVFTSAKYFHCNKNLICGCSHTNVEINLRVSDDYQTVPFSWSMIVSLQYDSIHFCAGTVLSESYVLTAANCLVTVDTKFNISKLTIVAGIHKRSQVYKVIRNVDQIIIHPNWTSLKHGFHHDIALIHLSEAIHIESEPYVSRTCLSSIGNNESNRMRHLSNETNLIAVGWNRKASSKNYSDDLQQTIVTIVDDTDTTCNANLIDKQHTQFCIRLKFSNRNACYDDAGRPVFQWIDDHWEQVGIASHTLNDCPNPSLVMYTRIAHYRDWIRDKINYRKDITDEPIIIITPIIENSTGKPTAYECDRNEVPCGCGRQNVQFPQSNPHNSHVAIAYSWSMIVSIRSSRDNNHLCSGSILSDSYILTTASCVGNIPSFGIIILAGIHNLSEMYATQREVDRIFLHPNYVGIADNYANDIAILHLSLPLNFVDDPYVSPICLPEKDESFPQAIYYPSPGTNLALIGWGSVNHTNEIDLQLLQQIEIYSISDQDSSCPILEKHDKIQFCAGIPDSEKVLYTGDLGSPIFHWMGGRWYQFGIASNKVNSMQFQNTGVFTRIVEFKDWIESITNSCSTNIVSPSTIVVNVTQFPVEITTPTRISYQCNARSRCGCGSNPVVLTPSRIVGGEDARENSWPMVISMRRENENVHFCGGTIISNNYILTAAHCVQGYVENPLVGLMIAAGMTNLSDPSLIQRTVDRIHIHPQYIGSSDHFHHDIALLHLNESLNIENNRFLTKTCIEPVESPSLSLEYIKNGTRLVVIGWGALSQGSFYTPQILQQVEVFAIAHNDDMCVNAMGNATVQFCAGLAEGGKDSCQGDSGGPIFQWRDQYWEQVGIVSYGDGCALPRKPGVYTRLSYYYDFINSILQNTSEYLERPNTSTLAPITSTSGSSFCHRSILSIIITIILAIKIII